MQEEKALMETKSEVQREVKCPITLLHNGKKDGMTRKIIITCADWDVRVKPFVAKSLQRTRRSVVDAGTNETLSTTIGVMAYH